MVKKDEINVQFRDETGATVGATFMRAVSTVFHRKETGHFDGVYRINSVEWNEHAGRHEVIYKREQCL